MKKKYDYLIVGAGLYGATIAYSLSEAGKTCLVVDKRVHTGGNIHTDRLEGIDVHTYGAHIFHTSDERVWRFVNRFVHFNSYINTPIAIYKGKRYNMPFNMNTFRQLWGVATAEEAQAKIAEQTAPYKGIEPANLEEQALKLVGPDIYKTLIKGYTEKQWGRSCSELPAFIIRRLPLRFEYNNNYFNDTYQGVPIEGYNALIDKLLSKTDVRLETDYLAHRSELDALAEQVVYTGQLDALFDYRLGRLDYRSLRFESEILHQKDFQGNAVMNYTGSEEPFTRIIEHKHFAMDTTSPCTVVTREYPQTYREGLEAYYPINDERNNALAEQYRNLAQGTVIFGGRLADYKYYDMDDTIAAALEKVGMILKHA